MSIVITHPEIVKQWHPTKNIGLSPENFTRGSKKKVYWLCPLVNCEKECLHEFASIIGDRCRGSGCPYCSGRLVCIHNSIEGKYPDIAKQWHPIKNGEILSSEVSISSGRKIWWLCEKTCSNGCLHEYQQRPSDKIGESRKCPYCCHQKICIHESILYTHPEIAKQWHPTKNGELLPSQFSVGSGRTVWWICDACKNGCCHEWEAQITNRTNAKSGCPYCVGFTENVCKCQSLGGLFPSLLLEWDPINEINPYEIPPKSTRIAKWICKNKHSYPSVIHHKSNGQGCPKCHIKTSKPARQWIQYLVNSIPNLTHFDTDDGEFKVKNTRYSADGYDESTKTIYEFHGCYYHGCKKCKIPNAINEITKTSFSELYEKTLLKKQRCLSEGFKYIEVWECEWKRGINSVIKLQRKFRSL